MQKLEILNTREVRKIKERLLVEFGFKIEKDYAWLLNEKGRLFIINKDLSRIDLKKLKIDKYGLYFGEWNKEVLRLSMEGAFLVGRGAKKNIIELEEKEVKKYFLGSSIEKDLGEEGKYILLKFGEEVIGCSRYKEGKILNFMPKIHRGEVILGR